MRWFRIPGRIILAVVGLALVLILVVLIVNLHDEDETPAVAARLAVPAADPAGDADNAAYLLWAFDAPAGVDAANLGRAIVSAYRAVPSDAVAQNDWRIHPLYTPAAFEFPAALACMDPASACVEVALNRPDLVRAEVASKAALFERLAAIDTAPGFGTIPTLEPVNAPLPPMKPLIGVYSLSLEDAAVQIRDHHAASGIGLLEQDVRIARRLLRYSDTLVMKAIATDLLRRAMLAYSEILRTSRDDPTTIAMLDASLARVAFDLIPAEADMSAVLRSEARRAADLAVRVAHPPASTEGTLEERIATRVAPLFFDPQATMNLEGELFAAEEPLIDAPPDRFAADVGAAVTRFARTQQEVGQLGLRAVYNPLGRVMASSVSNLFEYVARVHDDQALMRAVRAEAFLIHTRVPFLSAQKALDSAGESLWDPYLKRPFLWSAPEAALIVTRYSSRGVEKIKVPLT